MSDIPREAIDAAARVLSADPGDTDARVWARAIVEAAAPYIIAAEHRRLTEGPTVASRTGRTEPMAVNANGTRRIKLSKDQYECWRARCQGCGWPGSPWYHRGEAVAEFDKHDCGRDGLYTD